MRYYLIQIFKPGSTTVWREWTSYPKVGSGHVSDPGALNVTIDAYTMPYGNLAQQAAISIEGVSIEDLSQANNFSYCQFYMFAGFQAGLPLNNPTQAGLIIQGTINQAFGNWVGVSMSLDFVITAGGAVASQQTNISFIWKAGTPLANALAATLKTAFPTIKQNIAINSNLIIAHDEVGVYSSMPAFCRTLKELTRSVLGGSYPGVDIIWTPTQINVLDQSTLATPRQLAFQDMIGQPVYIEPYRIQWTSPMRADLTVGDVVTMPKGILGNPANPAGAPGAVITTVASQPSFRQGSIFQGNFVIDTCHHLGDFRQPDGLSWVTVFNASISAGSIPPRPTDSLAIAP